MANEFKLSYTASDINTRLGKIDNLANKNELPTKTSDLINDSDFAAKNYVQDYIQNYAQPIGDYALKSEIPTDYLTEIPEEYITESELNAKKYLTSFTETDPTVPDWAKAATKPTYTASEIGALPADTIIPSIEGLATETYIDEAIGSVSEALTQKSQVQIIKWEEND